MKILSLLEKNKNENFKQWFGDSKMVSSDGSPMVFYHGTASVFDEFKLSKAKDAEGMKLEMGWGPNKFYFSDHTSGANSSAEYAVMTGKGKTANVVPVHLKITNPIPAHEYLERMKHLVSSGHTRVDAIKMLDKQLSSDGVDGIIDKDSGGYAVFKPSQIKSVFNSGAWGAGSKLSESQELNETHYKDFYSKQFEEFRTKYLKKKTDRTLFVNFNNFYNNTVDKSFSPKLDHADPSGVYAYPLKYVIDHPMDVRYGATGKYLRVIKLNTADILHVQSLSMSEMRAMLWKTKEVSFEDALPYFKKHYDIKHIPKIWFNVMQLTADGVKDMVAHYSNKKNKSKFSVESLVMNGEAQKQMFLDLGFKAIEDSATNSTKAAINDWEPEQIIFLSKDAFEIVEVFHMGKAEKDTSNFITNVSTQYGEVLNRKIAAGVCDAIGDSLMSSKGATASRGGYNVYYTKSGRSIAVAEVELADHSDRKFAEKRHKEHKHSNTKAFTVYIISEKAKVIHTSKNTDSFQQIIKDVSLLWHNETGVNDKFHPVKSEAEDDAHIKNIRNTEFMTKNLTKLMKFKDFDKIRSVIKNAFDITLPEDDLVARVRAESIGKLVYVMAENEKHVKIETDDFRYPIEKVFADPELLPSIERSASHVPILITGFIKLLSDAEPPKVISEQEIIADRQKVLAKVKANPKLLGHSAIYTSAWGGEYFPLEALRDIIKLHA